MASNQAAKVIFLSHITEERTLAALIKEAVENEFSGFVDVFVSSDGISIPAGSNFLKRIENGLIDCIGAIYLISPASVRRPWINFELGAVWIRSAISERNGNSEIPALPFCHSGMGLRDLPPPIGSLNAIVANEASQLRFAFSSLQSAVGGRGALKTNFDQLADAIKNFEISYTVLDKLKYFFDLIESAPASAVAFCKANSHATIIDFGVHHFREWQYDRAVELANKDLKGIVTVDFAGFSSVVGDGGHRNGPEARVTFASEYILRLS